MTDTRRSGCPINLAVEVLGDRWTLIVLRDIIFGNRRHFRQLLDRCEERIASNILADRLKRLVDEGLITRAADPSHKQKTVYSLTEKAIALVPVLVHLNLWGVAHGGASGAHAARADLLTQGGPRLWEQFMGDLRVLHLGDGPADEATGVAAKFQAAFDEASRTDPTRLER